MHPHDIKKMSKLIKYKTPPLPQYSDELHEENFKINNDEFANTFASSSDMNEEDHNQVLEL